MTRKAIYVEAVFLSCYMLRLSSVSMWRLKTSHGKIKGKNVFGRFEFAMTSMDNDFFLFLWEV